MKRFAMLVPVLALLSACSEAAPPHILRTAGTHDCARESRVTVEASGIAVAFVGACERIVIKGDGNRITTASVAAMEISGKGNSIAIDAVDRISISGSDNTVRYRKSVTRITSFNTYGYNNDISQVR